MKKKTLLTITIILALSLSALILLKITDENSENSSDYTLPELNKNSIDLIIIKSPHDTIELTKSSGGWKVQGKKADSKKVENLLSAFENTIITGPTSLSDNYYSRFGLDKEKGVELTIKAGDSEETHLIIGKAGVSYNTTYFRPYDQTEVYTAKNNWNSVVLKTINEWRDKTVWSFSPGQVKKITAKKNGRVFEAKETDGNWTIASGGTTKKIDSLETAAASLEASGFTESKKEMNNSLTLYDENDQILKNFNLTKDDTNYYLQNNGENDAFTVSINTFEKIWPPALFSKKE